MTTQEAASLFVKSKLQASAALTSLIAPGPTGYGSGVYHSEAPAGSNYLPAVVYDVVPSDDTNAMGKRHLSRFSVLVRVVAEGRTFPYGALAAIDTALHEGRAVQSGMVCTCERTGEIRPMSDSKGGKRYRVAGARFTVFVASPL